MSDSSASPALQDTDIRHPMEDLSAPASPATATSTLTSATLRREDASVSTIQGVITASFAPEDTTETPSEVCLHLIHTLQLIIQTFKPSVSAKQP